VKHIAVIGGGAWGTAISTLLANNGHHVKLWCFDPENAEKIKCAQINEKYLPGIQLDEKITPVTDLKEAICGARWVFEAIPVKFLRSILERTRDCFNQDQVWVLLSKGIEKDTLLLPSQIIDDVFSFKAQKAVISGPSFALEVARKQMTGVTIAATDYAIGQGLHKLLASDYFCSNLSTDLIGVQVGGAVKNVITLAIGILDGAGYTDNTKTFVLTRGLQEIAMLISMLDGEPETAYDFSGVGDLVLTAMGTRSRNLEVGKRIGKGKTLEQILKATGYIPEGINTAHSINQLITEKKLKLPVCQGVYQMIFEKISVDDFLKHVMDKKSSTR